MFVIFTAVACAVLLFCQRYGVNFELPIFILLIHFLLYFRRNRYKKSKNLYLENGSHSFKIANVNPLLDQLAKDTNASNNEGFTAQKKDLVGAMDPCYYVLEGQTDECDK